MALSRKERAARCFDAAKDEIRWAREGITNKETAVFMARYYVRKGREFLYTSARVKMRADLKPW